MPRSTQSLPADQAQRIQALNPTRSLLVQAPAGSGKTDLLTRRFLRLLSEVDDPRQIVAITFTNAAAAEMRHRILSELEKATVGDSDSDEEFAMGTLASRALERSQLLGWNLLDLSAQLRITTIDSFCREIAREQPMLSGLGGNLDVAEQPQDLYLRAARATLEQIGSADLQLGCAIETLLLLRDNGWQELENLLAFMLEKRDRWMQEFVLDREPDWDALRVTLERPFVREIKKAVDQLRDLFHHVPTACDEAMELARFACAQSGNTLHRELAEMAEFPCGSLETVDEIEEARRAYACLANMVLTKDGAFRQRIDKTNGFPADRKAEKQRMTMLISDLRAIPGVELMLAAVGRLPHAGYTDEEWEIVRACFTLLRNAVGQLHVKFAEAGRVDFTEIAQRAQLVLRGPDQYPTDAAIALADNIHHLLVDEFQDTSRRQHHLIGSLVAAWPDTAGRTAFVVGDPMQSIYFFRDADAELFPRVKDFGLEIPLADPHVFEFAALTSNFRTAPLLVETINTHFTRIFAERDDSGIEFSHAVAARTSPLKDGPAFDLHLDFIPQIPRSTDLDRSASSVKEDVRAQREAAREKQTKEIVALIQGHVDRINEAKASGQKYRVAILARTRTSLVIVAQALRNASIPFRALDLESLADRPEVLDVLSLARALFHPEDRAAWLGVLRAPWCGLSLADLHLLAGNDEAPLLSRRVPDLLSERMGLLSDDGRRSSARLLDALSAVPAYRTAHPSNALGTWLEQIWRSIGGADCVDEGARANLDALWVCLDRLPDGEIDLLGRGLNAALKKLTAQPDPTASGDCGVQLMTIHKAKGLEFEVVIVPDLQALGGRTGSSLLSWLERGLSVPDASGEITEFLVAPVQPKGQDRGRAKEWVDRVYRMRESQEMRRILYVAATRAREELHLFARPTFKTDKEGELVLCTPGGSLLSTAWPALQQAVNARFEEWKQARTTVEIEIPSIAASGSNLLVMPSPIRPTALRRLPDDYVPPQNLDAKRSRVNSIASGFEDQEAYQRHEGGLLSRALGIAVHSFLEEIARLLATYELRTVQKMLPKFVPRSAARARSAGVGQDQAEQIAAEALAIALGACADETARWVLSPHENSYSEVRWTGLVSGRLRTVQIDRVFRAGPTPGSEGQDTWWIIDYKTAQAGDTESPVQLATLRPLFAPQLEMYAHVLRHLHGDIKIHAGLYYPRMLAFDSWEV